MKAEDAADMMDQDKVERPLQAARGGRIAILAMLLAVTGLGGANASKEATNNNIYAANTYASTRPRTSARPTTTSRPMRSNWRPCRTEASAPRPGRP